MDTGNITNRSTDTNKSTDTNWSDPPESLFLHKIEDNEITNKINQLEYELIELKNNINELTKKRTMLCPYCKNYFIVLI